MIPNAKMTKLHFIFRIVSNLFRFRFRFTVPFEEDESKQNIWFLDHNYIEGMGAMYKKVNGKKTNLQIFFFFSQIILCLFVFHVSYSSFSFLKKN